MNEQIKTICVFCGSSFGNETAFSEQSVDLGRKLAAKNWGLVYGGGTTGLMGAVARSCATNGGHVHGIIPKALISRERNDDDSNPNSLLVPDSREYGKTTLVDDMHTRKRLMGQEADAFVALPGGYGTLEELMEVVTWFQLNIHSKPIVVFNIDGFYDDFLKFIENAVSKGFVGSNQKNIIQVANTADEVFSAIENFEVPNGVLDLKWDRT